MDKSMKDLAQKALNEPDPRRALDLLNEIGETERLNRKAVEIMPKGTLYQMHGDWLFKGNDQLFDPCQNHAQSDAVLREMVGRGWRFYLTMESGVVAVRGFGGRPYNRCMVDSTAPLDQRPLAETRACVKAWEGEKGG